MTTVPPLRLDGELTIYSAQQVQQQLLQAMADLAQSDAPMLEVDLSGVLEIDTAGMQLLLAARLHAQSLHKDIRLVEPSEAVTEVIGLLGVAGHFDLAAAKPAAALAFSEWSAA